MNYYNEFDEFASQWIQNLVDGGFIPGGKVDARSVTIEALSRDDPAKLEEICELAKGYRAEWHKCLAGKRGLQRIEKMFAVIFGVTNMVEHRRVESHGESFSFISVRVP